MGCINSVTLSGNLVRTPELKTTKSGSVLARFSIAQNRKKSDGTEETFFFECIRFLGQSPSAAAQSFYSSLEKGRFLCVKGQLRQDRWEKDGQKRSSVYISVDELDTRGRPSADPQSYSAGQQMPVAAAPTYAPEEVYSEDIPF